MPDPLDAAAGLPSAYSYIRFSTPEQRKGDSFRRQITLARTYAAEHGLRLDESMRDEGVSGFRGKHRRETAALGAFLKRVEKGDIPRGSYLLVESLDRLSREEVVDALRLFMNLISSGITIVTLGDSREYSVQALNENFTELIISIVIMSRAHEESATKSKRVGAAWQAKRALAQERGQAMTARCPAWIRLEGGPRVGKHVLIPERAAQVRRWFEEAINGVGRRMIASGLNRDGVPTWGNGVQWHDSYIQKVLTNPAVYGAFTPKGKRAGGSDSEASETIQNFFPPVVDEETFWRAQAASKARGRRHGRTGAMHRNLLSGLAVCEVCGANMVYVDKGQGPKGGKPKLRCGRAHASAGCDHRTLYEYKPLEIGVIFGLGSRRQQLLQAAKEEVGEVDLAYAAAVSRRDAAKTELENLLSVVQAGTTGPIVARRLATLEADLAAAEKAVIEVTARRAHVRATDREKTVTDILDVYRQITTAAGDQRVKIRAFVHDRLKGLVEKVVIGPSGSVTHYKAGDRATMHHLGE
jgi:DNA invertase Pin-like site-specific DNA recombinase